MLQLFSLHHHQILRILSFWSVKLLSIPVKLKRQSLRMIRAGPSEENSTEIHLRSPFGLTTKCEKCKNGKVARKGRFVQLAPRTSGIRCGAASPPKRIQVPQDLTLPFTTRPSPSPPSLIQEAIGFSCDFAGASAFLWTCLVLD